LHTRAPQNLAGTSANQEGASGSKEGTEQGRSILSNALNPGLTIFFARRQSRVFLPHLITINPILMTMTHKQLR
jgi:hypothetical protein